MFRQVLTSSLRLIRTPTNSFSLPKPQGLYQLVEKDILVRCKKDDEKLVKSVIGDAVKNYEASTSRKVNVILDAENYLSADW